MFSEIQDALAAFLSKYFVDYPIYFEPIVLTGEGENAGESGNYIFVNIVPVTTTTVSKTLSDVSVLLDIAVHRQDENNKSYREMAEKLDGLLRPVFYFADRAITVDEAEIKIVDRLLHYVFSLRLRVAREPSEEETPPLMGELSANVELL